MRKIKKKIGVHFFSIDATDEFFEDFRSIQYANWTNEKPVRLVSIKDKKHLIKIYSPIKHSGHSAFFLSVVRERTTWQARALADGTISGIHSNQGLIGDLYYYVVLPANKSVIGFTAGTSATVRGVANAVLQQFNKKRTSRIVVEPHKTSIMYNAHIPLKVDFINEETAQSILFEALNSHKTYGSKCFNNHKKRVMGEL